MASTQDVSAVQINLPSWCATLPANPWNAAQIGAVLDALSGQCPPMSPEVHWQLVYRAVRQFWVQRASDTQPLIDVHDATSARPLSSDHEQAVKMLAYWDNYLETSHTNRIGKIKRRYRRPRPGVLVGVDPFGFGSPYARTD